MRTFTIAVALLVLSLHRAYSQGPATQPAFEVASITPCKPGTPAPPGGGPPMVKWVFPGGRFNANAATLINLIEWSWGIIPEQRSSGPSWMDEERYDIAARAGANASDNQIKLMVRTLLIERFKLQLRIEKKEMSVLDVFRGKNDPKLFPPKEGEVNNLKITRQQGADDKSGSFHVVATRFSLEELNETFARQLGRVIVDRTGLKGDFDFVLDFPFDEERPNPLDPSTVITAMRDQLGLTIKSEKGLADFFVIDSAEKVVAGN